MTSDSTIAPYLLQSNDIVQASGGFVRLVRQIIELNSNASNVQSQPSWYNLPMEVGLIVLVVIAILVLLACATTQQTLSVPETHSPVRPQALQPPPPEPPPPEPSPPDPPSPSSPPQPLPVSPRSPYPLSPNPFLSQYQEFDPVPEELPEEVVESIEVQVA